jgi:hypothetical protein
LSNEYRIRTLLGDIPASLGNAALEKARTAITRLKTENTDEQRIRAEHALNIGTPRYFAET